MFLQITLVSHRTNIQLQYVSLLDSQCSPYGNNKCPPIKELTFRFLMHKIPSLNLIPRKSKNVAPHLYPSAFHVTFLLSGLRTKHFADTSPDLLLHASSRLHFTFHVINFEILYLIYPANFE